MKNLIYVIGCFETFKNSKFAISVENYSSHSLKRKWIITKGGTFKYIFKKSALKKLGKLSYENVDFKNTF